VFYELEQNKRQFENNVLLNVSVGLESTFLDLL
jgi:hypothetical protein